MSQELKQLKKEVSQLSDIDNKEREEFLSDLRELEKSNQKYAQMKLNEIELNHKNEKEFIIICLIFGVIAILYIALKLW